MSDNDLTSYPQYGPNPFYVVSVNDDNQVESHAECWQSAKRRTRSEGDNVDKSRNDTDNKDATMSASASIYGGEEVPLNGPDEERDDEKVNGVDLEQVIIILL